MKLSLIIVAYKSGEILKQCLDSIHTYNDLGDDLEVIVVDNSPKDEKIESFVWSSNIDNIKYIPADNNGFGAGNNIGAKVSEGDILGFINPDIIFIEPVFKQILEDFNNNPKLATEGIKLLHKDLSSGYSFYYDMNTSVYKNYSIQFKNKKDEFNPKTMFTTGADIFIKKDIFNKVGMFDENIFMYHEEIDLKKRILNYDPSLQISYNKNLKAIHMEGATTTPSKERVKDALLSAIYVGKKHNLDFSKAIKTEINCYTISKYIHFFINRKNYHEYSELIKYLKKEFKEYL